MEFQQYSHEAFEATGIVTHVTKSNEAEIIKNYWDTFDWNKSLGTITHKAYETLHAVYFNYTDEGYDMLVGLLTETGAKQVDAKYTTITIPAQDYSYIEVPFESPANISSAWEMINQTPASELPRTYQYDLEMYSADMKSVTIAVGIKK